MRASGLAAAVSRGGLGGLAHDVSCAKITAKMLRRRYLIASVYYRRIPRLRSSTVSSVCCVSLDK
jgi:hypothetical protein